MVVTTGIALLHSCVVAFCALACANKISSCKSYTAKMTTDQSDT